MNNAECYFNGELSPDMKENFYDSLLLDGRELLNVISTIGLMNRAAALNSADEPPELEPPARGMASLADSLLELTLKALNESDPEALTDDAESVEIQAPVPQENLSSSLVQLITRLDSDMPILPEPLQNFQQKSDSLKNA